MLHRRQRRGIIPLASETATLVPRWSDQRSRTPQPCRGVRLSVPIASKSLHSIAQLSVGQIRRGAETQDVAAEIGEHAAVAQGLRQDVGSRAPEREKARAAIVRHGLDARHGGIDVERFECALQQPDLVPADLAQPLRRQRVLDVEREHGGRAIVRHRVVCRAREPRGSVAVVDPAGPLHGPRARRELARTSR